MELLKDGTYTARTDLEWTDEQHDFGIRDKFGRLIGARIMTCETDFTARGPEATGGYIIPAGHYYSLLVHATRNGRTYGACQSAQPFTTEAERTAAIAKYLKGAEARARKTARVN